jgi:bacterial/archaeal transporter family-2 protein
MPITATVCNTAYTINSSRELRIETITSSSYTGAAVNNLAPQCHNSIQRSEVGGCPRVDKAIVIGMITAIAAGTAIALQAALNNVLLRQIGLLETAFVVLLSGAVVCGVLTFWFGRGDLSRITENPLISVISGVLGIVILTGIVLTISQLGVTRGLATILIIQFSVLGVIDHFGFFGVERHPINIWTVVGISLLVVGAVVIRR